MEDLRIVAENMGSHRPVVDGNIINGGLSVRPYVSITSFLYGPTPDKLAAVDNAFTNNAMEGFDRASYFLSATRPYVLTEVIEEVNALAGILAKHYLIYTKRMREAQDSWANVNGKHNVGITNLEKIADRAGKLVDEMRKHEQIVFWEDVPIAKTLLRFSRAFSHDLVERTEEKHVRQNLPPSLGVSLETDQKLAAFCFLAAREDDTVIVTKDRGVIALVYRIQQDFFNKFKATRGIKDPAHKIAAYDLNSGAMSPVYSPSS